MSTKAITDKHEDRAAAGWQGHETAPSVLREDDLTVPRAFGMIGAALVIFGGMALAMHYTRGSARLSPSWSFVCLTVGLAGLLFHAAFDRDVQFRRMYMAFGFALLAVGAVVSLYPHPKNPGDQFRYGVPCLVLGLLFLVSYLRNETDETVRRVTEYTLGGAGALMAAVGLVGSQIRADFLLPFGLVLSVLGLAYLAAFVGTRGVSDDLGFRAGLALGGAGVVTFLIALGRSLLGPDAYLIPQGVVLMALGLAYVGAALLVCSDLPLVVLTRRELGAFFYSPIAYFVLFGFTLAAGLNFLSFVSQLQQATEFNQPLAEPILRYYSYSLWPVMSIIIAVPVLTMRLLSEEQRSGTMEVLLTAPVGEVAVVMSKFLAALLMYLTLCVPFGLFLAALWLAGAPEFDYRPLFAHVAGICVTGAAFVSMGLLFSSLTRSQVAAAVLTFVGMLVLTFAGLAKDLLPDGAKRPWEAVLDHVSYLEVWTSTLQGKVMPNLFLFFLSMTIFCLFVTVKKLEARKWF